MRREVGVEGEDRYLFHTSIKKTNDTGENDVDGELDGWDLCVIAVLELRNNLIEKIKGERRKET